MNTNTHKSDSENNTPVILILDDEEMILETLGALFESETSYTVRTFSSSVLALQELEKSPVDLVISDFLMAEMNGLDFLQQVKKMYPDVPCILLTGYADKENAIKAINEIGLFQYIEKPWDSDHLILIVRNALAYKHLNVVIKGKIKELDRTLLKLNKLAEKNEMLQDELSLAKKVQEKLLPEVNHSKYNLQISAKYIPALEIGGDFYDITSLNENQVAILIADITGHGVQAALSTVLLKMAFSSFNGISATTGDILTGMNDTLFKGLPQGVFVAALVLIVDSKTGSCRIGNGGVPHPILLNRKTGQVKHITVNGLVLGMTDKEHYILGQELTFQLEKDEALLLYTDGIGEALNSDKQDFESKYLLQTVEDNINKPGNEVLDTLVEAARNFSDPKHIWDDITLVSVELKE